MKRAFHLDTERLQALRAEEVARFKAKTPRSNALYAESRGLMPNGVPARGWRRSIPAPRSS